MNIHEDDDGILLNLSENQEHVYSKKKIARVNNQNARKYKRTQSNNTKLGGASLVQPKKKFVYHKKERITDVKNINELSVEEKVDKKPSEFISSLFTKNPEIPEVSMVKTQEIKSDELFVKEQKGENQISERLIKTLKDRFGFKYFTRVQQLSIPVLLSGKDTLIKSPTGSGKTLAYALPIVHQLQKIVPKISRHDGPYAIILLPTRELALQSFEVFEYLCRAFVWIVPGLIVGGEKRKAEKSRIRKGINIVIATPGRLLDHLKSTKSLSSKNVSFVIFDEADRLLDMGFQQTIIGILSILKEESKDHQTVLLSATLDPRVENLASISLKMPTCIDTTKESEEPLDGSNSQVSNLVTPETLQQYFAIIPAKLRLISLVSFVLKFGLLDGHGKLIIFFSSKSSTEFHFTVLQHKIINELCTSTSCDVFKLHGDMQQQSRSDVFKQFKKCHNGILLCTDVAARGLDLPQVNWIIQYSCPTQIDDYVHRVGRTARIGTAGKSLLFLLPSEVKYIERLEQQDLTMDEIKVFQILNYLLPEGAKKRNQSIIENTATELQNKLEEAIQSCQDLHAMAEQAFRSYIQAYATYPLSLKDIFHLKKIHLGHIAKSFALRKAPGEIKQGICQKEVPGRIKSKKARREIRKRRKVDMREEGIGLLLQGPRPGKRKKLQVEKKKS